MGNPTIGLCPRCGSVLSAVTFECARGKYCREDTGFVGKLKARLEIINRMIPGAKVSERRALQKERADLENKLSRVAP